MTPKLLNILLLICSAVLYYLFITPLYSGVSSGVWSPGEKSVKALIKQKSGYETTLLEADKVVSQAKILQKKYENYDEETKRKIMLMVPESVDSILLDELTRIVSDSGPVEGITIRNKGEGEYIVSFSVITTYTQFKTFITYWEKSMRLFSLQSVTFSPGKNDEALIKFNVEFSTYYMGRKPASY